VCQLGCLLFGHLCAILLQSDKPMTAAQKRLFDLRMRMNQSRKANNKVCILCAETTRFFPHTAASCVCCVRCVRSQAAVEEHRRQTDSGYEAREKKKEWEARSTAKKKALAGAPDRVGRSTGGAAGLLHETADIAARKHTRTTQKKKNRANGFGWNVFNEVGQCWLRALMLERKWLTTLHDFRRTLNIVPMIVSWVTCHEHEHALPPKRPVP